MRSRIEEVCSVALSSRAELRAANRRRAFSGERSRWLVSTSASYSSFDINTAEPLRDMISTSVWSRFTRSLSPKRSRLASDAVIAMVDLLVVLKAVPLITRSESRPDRPASVRSVLGGVSARA